MSSLRIRLFQRADFAFADSVRALAGWNQTKDDWMRFLNHQPDGCFIAEWDGQPAGTATTTIYEDKLAWIGMVLVHPDFQRRGIGRALLEHCLKFLQERHITCIKLDATPLGKRLYDQLGFKDEWTLQRWETKNARIPDPLMEYPVRMWQPRHGTEIVPLDLAAFGVARAGMLNSIATRAALPVVHVSPSGRVNGYAIARKGTCAHYLGPVVAKSLPIAGPLIKTLCAGLPKKPIFWDIPDVNTGAVELAQRLGFMPQRPLIRMFLGENKWPGDPQKIFALAGPEIG